MPKNFVTSFCAFTKTDNEIAAIKSNALFMI